MTSPAVLLVMTGIGTVCLPPDVAMMSVIYEFVGTQVSGAFVVLLFTSAKQNQLVVV